jgi:hypothetical protein
MSAFQENVFLLALYREKKKSDHACSLSTAVRWRDPSMLSRRTTWPRAQYALVQASHFCLAGLFSYVCNFSFFEVFQIRKRKREKHVQLRQATFLICKNPRLNNLMSSHEQPCSTYNEISITYKHVNQSTMMSLWAPGDKAFRKKECWSYTNFFLCCIL